MATKIADAPTPDTDDKSELVFLFEQGIDARPTDSGWGPRGPRRQSFSGIRLA